MEQILLQPPVMAWDPETKRQWCRESVVAAMEDGINLFSRDTLVGTSLMSERFWGTPECQQLKRSIITATEGSFSRRLVELIDSWRFGSVWRTRWLFEAAITAGIDAWCTELVSREDLSVDFTSLALRSRRIEVMRLSAKDWTQEVNRARLENNRTREHNTNEKERA